jgi:hypothetical protein
MHSYGLKATRCQVQKWRKEVTKKIQIDTAVQNKVCMFRRTKVMAHVRAQVHHQASWVHKCRPVAPLSSYPYKRVPQHQHVRQQQLNLKNMILTAKYSKPERKLFSLQALMVILALHAIRSLTFLTFMSQNLLMRLDSCTFLASSIEKLSKHVTVPATPCIQLTPNMAKSLLHHFDFAEFSASDGVASAVATYTDIQQVG